MGLSAARMTFGTPCEAIKQPLRRNTHAGLSRRVRLGHTVARMTEAPWLKADGSFRCFFCETPKDTKGRQRDPDSWHVGLRESHQLLVSRPLPNGDQWTFEPVRGWYLKNLEPSENEPDEWSLGSDNFATTHTNSLPDFAAAIPGYANGHVHEFCTIGGYIVFPNGLAHTRPTTQRARRWTLNQARGCDRQVSDRFDLTLEAIRLYFAGITVRAENPLGDVMDAYGWFFDCFGQGSEGFEAYVDYFFLDPFIAEGRVRPLYRGSLNFADALPRDASQYHSYIQEQRQAVGQRNDLIAQWWATMPSA